MSPAGDLDDTRRTLLGLFMWTADDCHVTSHALLVTHASLSLTAAMLGGGGGSHICWLAGSAALRHVLAWRGVARCHLSIRRDIFLNKTRVWLEEDVPYD